MSYRLVIFDFDGTLADSFPFFATVVNGLAARHRFKQIDLDAMQEWRRYSARQMMEHVGLPAWKLPMVAHDFRTAMKENPAATPLFAGVGELLAHLAAQGTVLAVVSANSYENISHILGSGNTKQIRFFECGTSIFGKAARLRRVLRKSGIMPAEAIYIGDQTTDAEAARQAGIAFGAVAWGYGDIASLRQCRPDLEFRSVADMRLMAHGLMPASAATRMGKD